MIRFWQQYKFFVAESKTGISYSYDPEIAPTPDCPAIMINWSDAARYCNWLSFRENIEKSEWCYSVNENGVVLPKPNHLNKLGYRLPT